MAAAKRRLAAVLAADVAGYSRLMAADEQATLDALNAARSVFREHILSHDGRVVDTAGDSVLAVFASVVEAAGCAIEIQRELVARNEPLAVERRMRFRMGLNLGDIVEQDDGTVYGDGVNIAARLQAIAEPDGVAVSGAAHDFLEGRIEAPMRFLGEQELKNIAGPVRTYALDWFADVEARAAAVAIDRSAKHSIAVLPFANLSRDEEAGRFADGLAAEVLDSLSRAEHYRLHSPWPLKVASRSASFQLAEGNEDLSAKARRLGVHYLLEGSVRRMGASLRITAQLVRAADGFHVWSKSYERRLDDGFEIETRVAQNIAHLAADELLFDQWRERIVDGDTFGDVEPAAVKHFIDAEYQYHLIRRGEGGDWALYEQLLKTAVEADPAFALAHSLLAFIYVKRVGGRLPLDQARAAARASIDRALSLKPDSTMALWQLGEIQLNLDLDYAAAEANCREVLKRSPSNIWMHYNLATIALREGRTREASRILATASALDAGYEEAGFLSSYAWLLNVLGDYGQALKVCGKGLSLATGGPERATILLNQARALVQLGRAPEAEPLIAEAWDLDGHDQPEPYAFFYATLGQGGRARSILGEDRDALSNKYALALGHLALGELDSTFEAIEAAIRDHDALLADSLRTAEWWGPIRDDPRYPRLVDHLAAEETHTERYAPDRAPPART
jgi:adenylate cyclase